VIFIVGYYFAAGFDCSTPSQAIDRSIDGAGVRATDGGLGGLNAESHRLRNCATSGPGIALISFQGIIMLLFIGVLQAGWMEHGGARRSGVGKSSTNRLIPISFFNGSQDLTLCF